MVKEIGSKISIVIIQREAELSIRPMKGSKRTAFSSRLVRGIEGFVHISEGWQRVIGARVGRGRASEGVSKEGFRGHEVVGIERAGNEAIGIAGIVLDWEKSGEGVKGLLRG